MSTLSKLIFLTLAIFVVVASADKSYPLTKECKYCKYDYECETGFCHQNKCLWRNRASLTKCFVGECGYCKFSSQCISGLCNHYKCVPKLRPYFKKCFPYGNPKAAKKPTPTPTPTPTPSPKLSYCTPCKYDSECYVGKCTDYYCAKPYNVQHCKNKECEACKYDYNCKSGKCKRGICIKTYHSFHKCKHY